MLSISKHLECLFSEVLRFFLDHLMNLGETDLYVLEDEEFNNRLKSVIEQIKRIMNFIMDDVLEQYEEQYLERRKFLKSQSIIDLNQNQ